MSPWVLAARPRTLSLAVVPVLAATALAWAETGIVLWPVMWVALAGAALIQIGTNLHNDVADFERGADTRESRVGPTRVSAEGLLRVAQVRNAAYMSYALAALAGAWLVYVGGWPILALGVASIAAGLAYTGGPRPLGYMGLGELFVWLFFGLGAVLGTYYLHTGTLSDGAVLVGAALGMPAAAVLVVNNTRDRETDAEAGKHTLAVRLGLGFSRSEYAVLMLLPFVLLFLLPERTVQPLWLLAVLVVLPWAVQLVRRFAREDEAAGFNRLLVATARQQALLGMALCVALVGSHAAAGAV